MRNGQGVKSGDGRQAATPEIISGEGFGGLASKIRGAIARRAFELFEARGYEHGRDLEDWFRAESELVYPVKVDIRESDRELCVTAEMADFGAADLKIGVEPRQVIIWGQSGAGPGRRQGRAHRACRPGCLAHLDLPANIDPSKASARLAHGLLKLELPKVLD